MVLFDYGKVCLNGISIAIDTHFIHIHFYPTEPDLARFLIAYSICK